MTNIQQQLLLVDSRVATRVEAIRTPRDWWPCRRGCDQCCRQLARPPILTSCEWERIDAAVVALPSPIRAEVEQKIKTLLAQIASDTVGSRVVCPFLDDSQGACRIYEARPIACRTYGFFVSRGGDDYCQIVEAEVASQGDRDIVWGNANAIDEEMKLLDPDPIPFEEHYKSMLQE